jgi:hypothetical protein
VNQRGKMPGDRHLAGLPGPGNMLFTVHSLAIRATLKRSIFQRHQLIGYDPTKSAN